MADQPSEDRVLFESMQLGAIEVTNRIFMAPLTRSRANRAGDVPTVINAR